MNNKKVLLISYYWYPYNNSGTFRWVNFGKYISFDVLTIKNPMRCFVDNTIPNPDKKVIRFGHKIPAVVWGMLAWIRVLFMQKYDLYIITSPPESLLCSAWIMQLFGKKVLVDMRDAIDRKKQYFRKLIVVYKWFYNRIKNVVVSWQFIDKTKDVVYHGYEEVEKKPNAPDKPFFYKGRVLHGTYLRLLSEGNIPDQSGKPEGYATSSLHTILQLGYLPNQKFHKEVRDIWVRSFAVRANEMMKIALKN